MKDLENIEKFIVQKLDGWYFYDKTFTNITGPYEFMSVCILNCMNFHDDPNNFSSKLLGVFDLNVNQKEIKENG